MALRQRDRTSLNEQPISDSKLDDYNATIEWKLGEVGTLTSRSAYRRQHDYQVYDLDGTPRDPGTTFTGATYDSVQFNLRRTFVQQLDYSGTFGSFTLLAGAFYYNDKYHNDSYDDIGNNVPLSAATAVNPTYSPFDIKTKSWAGYIDGTYNINDQVFVTVGGRYAHDEKGLSRKRYSATPLPPPSPPLGYFVPAENTACYTGGPRASSSRL